MDNLKSTLFSFLILAVLGGIGYWAVTTLQSGPEHLDTQEIKELKKENSELKKEIKSLNTQLASLQPKVEDTVTEVVKEEPKPIEEKPKVESAQPTKYKNQTLIDELQKLVDGNIFIKLKSQGTRVGTVQKFLNLYNKTSNRIDNDYGTSTQKLVIDFQKDQGLKADGELGPTTFKKMIDWLKKQG